MNFKKKAALAGIRYPERGYLFSFDENLSELRALVNSLNIEVVGEIFQRRNMQDPSTVIGKGKLEELKDLIKSTKPDYVIFDTIFTPSQRRNLREALSDTLVIDRYQLILEVFAHSALTKEAKLQVELAYNLYKLSQLKGIGISLSDLGGGIGTRGPGEKELEYDRRALKERIYNLKTQIEKVKKEREIQRKASKKLFPQVSIVGYTNAGKSSLFNTLCQTNTAKVADSLFTTLDPLHRLVKLPNSSRIILTDTVGFIQRLPTELVYAFRATLEELFYADLLLHVVDISSEFYKEKLKIVEDFLLKKLGIKKQILIIFNKIDKVDNIRVKNLKDDFKDSVFISCLTKEGIGEVLDMLCCIFPSSLVRFELNNKTKDILKILENYGDVEKKVFEGKKLIFYIKTSEYLALKLGCIPSY